MMHLFNMPGRVQAIFAQEGKKPPYSPDDVRAALATAKKAAHAEFIATLQMQKQPP